MGAGSWGDVLMEAVNRKYAKKKVYWVLFGSTSGGVARGMKGGMTVSKVGEWSCFFDLVGCFHGQSSPGGYSPCSEEHPEPVVAISSKSTLSPHSYRLQEEIQQVGTVDTKQGELSELSELPKLPACC